jgi:transposase-like protein
MERQRRSFTEEYKRQAVELVLSSGRSITSVGKELGLRDSVLRRWVDKLRQEPASAGWGRREERRLRNSIFLKGFLIKPPRPSASGKEVEWIGH